jgi:putative flippase GtrA
MEHRTRFATFSVIGAAIFVIGLAMQAALTGWWHMNADLSFVLQGIVSVQASFVANYYWTWRDQDVAFWPACGKFNAQKVASSIANLIVYAVLVKAGLNYLLANVADTAVFTVINYVTSHLWVFTPKDATADDAPAFPAVLDDEPQPWWPTVSVVVPCRDNSATIRATVDALLGQEYPRLEEVILVGSTGDTTWSALSEVTDPRLVLLEQEQMPGLRDPAVKRDKGVRKASGEVIALADSDIVMEPDWLRRGVGALIAQGGGVVAGGMRSIHDTFWGRFVDKNRLGAKTPRLPAPYLVTARNFGRHNRKPPITANVILTREVYEDQPIDRHWMYGYEDYEWFWRVTKAGHRILFTDELTGRHHHRRSFRHLVTEYRRAAHGCANFIKAHPDSPLARKRRQQALLLPSAGLAGFAAAGAAVAEGQWLAVTMVIVAGMGVLMAREVKSSRTAESLAYPIAGGTLGVVFTLSITRGLLFGTGSRTAGGPTWDTAAPAPPRRRICWPLVALLALQAVLSGSLVWSNTAFTDEAQYLWAGHLEIAHYLHGASLPVGNAAFQNYFSGAPQIYPVLGAAADSLGGVAAARILSLIFMLAVSMALYFTASRLFGQTAALAATALWVTCEPCIRLAFATYDPLAVLLICFGSYVAVDAACRCGRFGERVLLAAVVLGLGCITAYSYAVYVPVSLAVILASWVPRLGKARALTAIAWMTAAVGLIVLFLATVLKLWPGILATTIARTTGINGVLPVVRDSWQWGAVIMCLGAIACILAAAVKDRDGPGVWLVVILTAAAVIAPLNEIRLQTGVSLDKHMAVGLWLAAMAAGWAVSRLLQLPGSLQFPSNRKVALGGICAAALAVPAIISWQGAYSVFHLWPDAARAIPAFNLVTSADPGRFLIAQAGDSPVPVLRYYSQDGDLWRDWTGEPLAHQLPESAYARQIRTGRYSVIAIPFDIGISSPGSARVVLQGLSQDIRQRGHQAVRQELLNIAGYATVNAPGLYAFATAVADDHDYRVASVVPYSSHAEAGIYVIWRHAGVAR